jgi:hypothetical protein
VIDLFDSPDPRALADARRSRLTWLTVLISVVAMFVALGSAAGTYYVWRTLRPAIDDLDWSTGVIKESASANRIQPEIETVQFLKNGLSIQLETARYDTDGLILKGYVGNPTNLWVNNLTLNFRVKQPIFSGHTKFVASPLRSQERQFVSAPDIGVGQTEPIASLGPGRREPFEVAIPNVKQNSDGIDLRVDFSGERYSYPSVNPHDPKSRPRPAR